MTRILSISLCLLPVLMVGQDAFFKFHPAPVKVDLSRQYWNHTKRNAFALPLMLLAGAANGAMDVQAQKHSSSVWADLPPDHFWGRESWRRKWNWTDDGRINGERFWGSSTFLVWTTDGWHLSKTISLTSLQTVAAFRKSPDNFWLNVADLVVYKLLYSAGWHVSNKLLLNEKN